MRADPRPAHRRSPALLGWAIGLLAMGLFALTLWRFRPF